MWEQLRADLGGWGLGGILPSKGTLGFRDCRVLAFEAWLKGFRAYSALQSLLEKALGLQGLQYMVYVMIWGLGFFLLPEPWCISTPVFQRDHQQCQESCRKDL